MEEKQKQMIETAIMNETNRLTAIKEKVALKKAALDEYSKYVDHKIQIMHEEIMNMCESIESGTKFIKDKKKLLL